MIKFFQLQKREIDALSYHFVTNGANLNQLVPQLTQAALFQGFSVQPRNDGGVNVLRADAAGAGYGNGSTAYSRDELVTVLKDVLRKRRSKLQAREVFSVKRDVSPGSTSWRQHRMDYTGEPQILGQGGKTNDTPQVTIAQDYQDFPVEYYALVVEMSFVESLAAQNLPGVVVNKRAEKMRAARDAMERYQDKRIWKRVGGAQTQSVLDNPWMTRVFPSVVFSFAANGLTMYRALLSIINVPRTLHNDDSGSARVLLLPPNIHGVIESVVFDDDPSVTIKQAILANTSIEEIIEVSALRGAGEGGLDVIMAIDPDTIAIQEVMPPTALPGQMIGLSEQTFMVGADGGVQFTDVISNVQAHVQFTDPHA